MPLELRSQNVKVDIKEQVATTNIRQVFFNPSHQRLEGTFIFPIPRGAQIDKFSMEVNGKMQEAELLDAKKARKIYEDIVRKAKDPALFEYAQQGLFKVRIFPIEPRKEKEVKIKYTEILPKDGNMVRYLYHLNLAKYSTRPIKDLSVKVEIESEAGEIKSVYSPSHEVEVKRHGKQRVVVGLEEENLKPDADLQLYYSLRGKDGGDVDVAAITHKEDEDDNGYFMLLVSPGAWGADRPPMPKDVVFVFDSSGSMRGKKIEQAKGALRFVLNNLNKGDLFNIVAYDTEIESFQPEMQRYGDSTRKQALGFVEGIHAGGSTNIDGALTAAFEMLKDDQDPSYVIFLTDGLPTAGQTNPNAIVSNATKHNAVRARIFNFGVGYDVNSRLLDKLARECFGQSQYVRPDEDIEAQVSRLYERIGAPAMTDIAIHYDIDGLAVEKGAVTNRVYPKDAYDLFAGDQLVLVGRYKHSGAVKLTVKGRVGGKEEKFDFKGTLVKHSAESSRGYVERLWAMRRIGEIIDKIDLEGRTEELVDELIALSKRHGILTPYTSFLADDTGGPLEEARGRQLTNEALDQLSAAPGGKSGVVQRAAKAALQRGNAAGFSSGGARVLDLASDKEVTLQTVQNVRTKTFFQRNGIWEDSTITEKQKKVAFLKISQQHRQLVSVS